ELFVARYIEVKPLARVMKPGDSFVFSARMLKREHTLNHIEIFYEPLPKPPELDWLRVARSYSLPDQSRALRPKVMAPLMYSDGTRGEIDIQLDGSFSAPVTLFHDKPCIYTIVAWIRRRSSEKAFPATEVCIRAE